MRPASKPLGNQVQRKCRRAALGAGAVTLLGDQVIHDPNGNWFYVYAPGIDQPILGIRRNPPDTTLLARLDMVSDGSGRLVAIAQKDGTLDSQYAQQISRLEWWAVGIGDYCAKPDVQSEPVGDGDQQ